MTKRSKKIPKNPILGPFWLLFAQIWAEMYFPGKIGSVSFQIFQLSTIIQEIREN